MSSNLSAILIVIPFICCNVLWKLDIRDLKIIWSSVGCMGTNEKSVSGKVLVRVPRNVRELSGKVGVRDIRFDVREPLCC